MLRENDIKVARIEGLMYSRIAKSQSLIGFP